MLALAVFPCCLALQLGPFGRRPPGAISSNHRDRRQRIEAAPPTVSEHIAAFPELHVREIVIDASSTVRDCITTVRRLGRESPQTSARISELGRIWVTDGNGKLDGYVGATEMLLSEPSTLLSSISRPVLVTLSTDDDLADALDAVREAGVAVAPVVDEKQMFVGALSPSEIIATLEAEATEDVSRYSASGSRDTYFGSPALSLVKNRAVWLLSLLMLQSLSSVVLGRFAALLERNLLLALFLTMLTGTAGNAGNQTSAMVIRGLATGEIDPKRDAIRVLRKEICVAAPLALLLGVASFGRVLGTAAGKAHALRIAFVVGISMTTTVLAAIIVGTGAPLILDRLGVDPCNCASPALATVVDLLGVIVLCKTGQLLL